MSNKKSSAKKQGMTLKELQDLQQKANLAQDSLEALLNRIQEIQKESLREFLELFQEIGMELSQEEIDSIKREIKDIKGKHRTIEGLKSRYNVFKDLIELKKALIETSKSNKVKEILTEQKITEILLKNRVIIEIIYWHILKTHELKMLRAKLPC